MNRIALSRPAASRQFEPSAPRNPSITVSALSSAPRSIRTILKYWTIEVKIRPQ